MTTFVEDALLDDDPPEVYKAALLAKQEKFRQEYAKRLVLSISTEIMKGFAGTVYMTWAKAQQDAPTVAATARIWAEALLEELEKAHGAEKVEEPKGEAHG